MKKLYLLFVTALCMAYAQYPNLISQPYFTENEQKDVIKIEPYGTGCIYGEFHAVRDTASYNIGPNWIYTYHVKVFNSSLDLSSKTELFNIAIPVMVNSTFPAEIQMHITDDDEIILALYDNNATIRVIKYKMDGTLVASNYLYPVNDYLEGTFMKIKETRDTINLVYTALDNIHWIQLDDSVNLLKNEIFPRNNNDYMFCDSYYRQYMFEFLDNGEFVHEYLVTPTQSGIVSRNQDGSVNWAHVLEVDDVKLIAFETDTTTGFHYLVYQHPDAFKINITKISPDFSSTTVNKHFEFIGSTDLNKVCYFKRTAGNSLIFGFHRSSNMLIKFDLNCNPQNVLGTAALGGWMFENARADYDIIPVNSNILLAKTKHVKATTEYYHVIKTIDLNNLTNTCYTSSSNYILTNQGGHTFRTFTPAFLNQFSTNLYPYPIDSTYYPIQLFGFYELCNTQLGVSDQDENLVTIYPNPVSQNGIVQITGIETDVKYDIISMNGQVIQTGFTQNLKINFRDMSCGMYFIRLNGQISKAYKVVVQ